MKLREGIIRGTVITHRDSFYRDIQNKGRLPIMYSRKGTKGVMVGATIKDTCKLLKVQEPNCLYEVYLEFSDNLIRDYSDIEFEGSSKGDISLKYDFAYDDNGRLLHKLGLFLFIRELNISLPPITDTIIELNY